jgi:hypothetical protein
MAARPLPEEMRVHSAPEAPVRRAAFFSAALIRMADGPFA